jgi:SAM-dependent methyltransferase
MKAIDRLLQAWRIEKSRRYIRPGARILDIGSADGALFRLLRISDERSTGIDPTLEKNTFVNNVPLIAGHFPKDMPSVEPFDVITMFAVLEHFPEWQYENLKLGCAQFLKPGGLLLITVPSPKVDVVLAALKYLRLIDGVSFEQHHGFAIDLVTAIFSPEYFRQDEHTTFQFGLNHLFIFSRQETNMAPSWHSTDDMAHLVSDAARI